MAARLRKNHDEETRKKIKAGVLIDRLTKAAEGKLDLTPAQVTAARALLNKVLPDLKAVELSGSGENGEHEVIFKTVYE